MAIIDESALTAAKIRDMPISAELRRVLLAAAHEAGVEIVRITSGGQPGSRGQRTGSNRHDGLFRRRPCSRRRRAAAAM
jgi:hypothetical protein